MDLNDLEQTAASCTLCELHEGRLKPVFAKGNPKADIMICGMVPAKEENLAGQPFVGRAGKLLDSLLEESGLTYDDVYITNLVKCFLAAGKTLDKYWVMSCYPYLQVQISIIRPKIILALGKDAAFALLGKEDGTLGSVVGKMFDLYNDAYGTKIYPTYHPSYILRRGGKNSQEYARVVADFKNVLTFCS